MTQIEWSMWANEQAVVSGLVLMTGSIVGIAGQFHNWVFGIYGLVASLIILMIEWPRGKRIKGRTMERTLCVPCCFIIATVLGGVCLLMTSIIYFMAAMKGEEWRSVYTDKTIDDKKPRARSLHPPKKPPPRLNQGNEGASVNVDSINVDMTDNSGQAQGPASPTDDKKPRRPPPRPKAPARGGVQESRQ